MKRMLKRCVPLLLAVAILASVAWYLLVYDREFTRDVLLSQARNYDARGSAKVASFLYDLAYDYTGQDEDVAIELASQYRSDGNYTKAEYTLTNAIADGGTAELYIALCKTFVEQDKLLDAVNMLDSIADPAIKAQMDALRPDAPAADPIPGYYTQYISVDLSCDSGSIHFTTDGEYPSMADPVYTEPITLSGGETIIHAVTVSDNGLVSPLTILGYTVGGVIEEAKFADPAMELAVRDALGFGTEDVLMTDMLWEITDFTVPAETAVFDDLKLLPYLKKLTIEDQKFDSLSPLAYLTELEELHLTGCRFPSEDLKIVAALPALQKLTLSNCGLSTIADLSGARNLTYLDLSHNTLRNLEVLSGMGITELYLQHNAVTELDILASLTELNKLDISYNAVSKLAPLSACGKLTWLNAGNNAIADLSGIETFPALTHLDVDHNRLGNVTILGQCMNLTELNISNNSLTEINSLSNLTGLVALNFSYNEVSKLPTWPEGSALSILEGSYNKVESVYPLHNLEELTYVYLDYNQLHTVDPIADCYRLVMVNVYGNEIQDVSQLTEHNIIVNYDPT